MAIRRFISWNIASAASPRRLCSSGVISGSSANRSPRTTADLRAGGVYLDEISGLASAAIQARAHTNNATSTARDAATDVSTITTGSHRRGGVDGVWL